MKTLPRRAVRTALLLFALLLASSSQALGASTGKIKYAKPADSAFASYVDNPTADRQQWMRDHYSRMRTYSPYFDSRLSWYPNAWSYEDAYAIYTDASSPNWAASRNVTQYILRDAQGNPLYIPFGCSSGTCPQYAADIGDPGWRQYYINVVKDRAAKGYKGIFVDDVNLSFSVSNEYGNFVAPIDKRTGAPMTLDNWQRYFAEFMEQLRAALPADFEIVQNQVFWHAGLTNAYVKRAIEASTHLEIERGVIDTGMVGGTGTFGYETALAWAEYAHSRGKGVIWDAQATWGREYAMATYFLVDDGRDLFAHPTGDNPDNWWSGYDVDLGTPLGQRYSWNGVFRRDFERGIVLVNQPGQSTKTLDLGSGFKTMGGATVSSISLPGREGAVLLGAGATTQPVSVDKALGKPTSSSSTGGSTYLAQYANDGNSSTRWQSAAADDQWWHVDLGSVQKVDAVELNWEWAYASRYKILTSVDGTAWTERADVSLSATGVKRSSFTAVDARYVRVLGVTRATQWGFSFWDARVLGPQEGGSTPPPPPPPPPPPSDTTAPDTAITGGPSGTTTSTSASFVLTSTESGSSFEYRLDGGGWTRSSSAVNLTGLSRGTHTLYARATDAAGNLDASPATRTWTVAKKGFRSLDATAARRASRTQRRVLVKGRVVSVGPAGRVRIELRRFGASHATTPATRRVRLDRTGRFRVIFSNMREGRYRARVTTLAKVKLRVRLTRGTPRMLD